MLRQELAELETHYGDLLQRGVRRVDGLVQENETLKADYAKLLESSSHIKAEREKQIAELRSQLDQERADREEIEGELADLKQNSEIDFDYAGKAGELVSWLRKTVGKSLPKQVTIKEVQKILEGRDN
jgi:predicted RNase H-like nuclease (RuvC/YqgF family)